MRGRGTATFLRGSSSAPFTAGVHDTACSASGTPPSTGLPSERPPPRPPVAMAPEALTGRRSVSIRRAFCSEAWRARPPPADGDEIVSSNVCAATGSLLTRLAAARLASHGPDAIVGSRKLFLPVLVISATAWCAVPAGAWVTAAVAVRNLRSTQCHGGSGHWALRAVAGWAVCESPDEILPVL